MLIIPKCFDCQYFNDAAKGMCCEAYPNGIPYELIYESGQNTWEGKCADGYQFKKKINTTSQ